MVWKIVLCVSHLWISARKVLYKAFLKSKCNLKEQTFGHITAAHRFVIVSSTGEMDTKNKSTNSIHIMLL